MFKTLLAVGALLLSGCASRTTRIKTATAAWVGHPVSHAITAWGQPWSVYEEPGTGLKVFTWVDISSYTKPVDVDTTDYGSGVKKTRAWGGGTLIRTTKKSLWAGTDGQVVKWAVDRK